MTNHIEEARKLKPVEGLFDNGEPLVRLSDAQAALNAQACGSMPPHVRDFLGKVQGVCLGVAMSGRDHPNPDGVLMDLFNEAQKILFPDAITKEPTP